MEFRDEKLQDIISEAQARLPSIKSDPDAYSQLLFELCLETFYRLMENEITLECLKEDEIIVKAAAEKARSEFRDVSFIDLRLSIVPSLNKES